MQSHQTSTTQVYPRGITLLSYQQLNYYCLWYQLLTLDFSLRRSFHWMFVIADVQTSVLGADLLGLLVDEQRTGLTDEITHIKIQGILYAASSLSPSLLPRQFLLHSMLLYSWNSYNPNVVSNQ